MSEARPADAVLAALHAARAAEKEQTVFYRRLAVLAEEAGDPAPAERLNGLLADEQHHLSRITARLIEWGEALDDVGGQTAQAALDKWEPVARAREFAEIDRYETLITLTLDERTRRMIDEFIAAERRHAEQLGGKWMDA